MATCGFTEKSRLTSFWSDGRKKLFAAVLSLLLAAIAAFVGVYAWFSVMQSSNGTVVINSNGIKLDAELYYVDTPNFEGTPTDSDYVLQQKKDKRIEQSGNCFAGSVLYYKMTVSNISGEENIDRAVAADISLSMSELGGYFEKLVALYQQDPTNSQIQTTIDKNNGTLLFFLRSVKYQVADSMGTGALQTFTLPDDASIFSQYAFSEPFFKYKGLENGAKITVYFELECSEPFTVSSKYTAFREAQIAGETDEAKKAAVRKMYEAELQSLVIKPDEGSGLAELVSNAYLNISYFSVYATPSL